MKRCCRNCHFAYIDTSVSPLIAQCRRNAPVENYHFTTKFPSIANIDNWWCGEFTPKVECAVEHKKQSVALDY